MAVAIYNNVGGTDAEVLKSFGEPSWNNPVVRYLDAEGKDLLPRQDGDWSLAGTLGRMKQALAKAKRPVPEWLHLTAFEASPRAKEQAVFAMYCYWEGEKKLGSLEGVLATSIGSLEGSEVVEVTFDPTILPYEKLVSEALKMDCAHRVFARTEAQESIAKKLTKNTSRTTRAINTDTQQQYHLAHVDALHRLPLTPLQATKMNADAASGRDATRWLSPSQRSLKEKLDASGALQRLKTGGKPARTFDGLAKEIERMLAVLDS